VFALDVPPPLFLHCGVLAMSESPRWLALRGHDGEACVLLERTSESRVRLTVGNRPVYRGNRRPGPVTVPSGYQPLGLGNFEF
jgi:hypothetical protein